MKEDIRNNEHSRLYRPTKTLRTEQDPVLILIFDDGMTGPSAWSFAVLTMHMAPI
jgi:hypothetical protein